MTPPTLTFELLLVASICLSGAFTAIWAGARPSHIWLLSAPFGLLGWVVLGSTMQMVGLSGLLPSLPLSSIAISATLASHRALKQPRVLLHAIGPALVVCGILALGYGAILDVTHYKHVDTLEYLTIGAMIYEGSFLEGVSLYQLQKRQLSMPLLHLLANAKDAYYLNLIHPLITLSVLASMSWVLLASRLSELSRVGTLFAVGIALLAMLTTNRFVMHTFYLNGHMLAGLEILLIAGAGWLLATGAQIRHRLLFVTQTLAAGALIVTRPEGFLLAALAIAPTLLGTAASSRYRFALALAAGTAIAAWHAYLSGVAITMGRWPRPTMLMPLIFGLGLIGSAGLTLIRKDLDTAWRILDSWIEPLLWIALAGLATLNSDIFMSSLYATATNIRVYWGNVVWILALSVITFAILCRGGELRYLRFVVTSYLPAVFILSFLRDGAYRVGGGDSLNRMWISIFPLAIMYLTVAAVTLGARGGASPRTTPNSHTVS